MNDREILNLLKIRKKAGLELLYEQHGPAIYGIVARLSTTNEIAEQLLVEIFLEAWKEARHLDVAKTDLLSWLLNLSINTIQQQINAGKIDRTALQPFPELGDEPDINKDRVLLLQRLEKEVELGLSREPVYRGRSGDDKLQYSILALRARMQINKALLAK